MNNQTVTYENAKDPYIWAFNWLLNCTHDELKFFIEAVKNMSEDVDPVFLWAAQAIEAMADNNG